MAYDAIAEQLLLSPAVQMLDDATVVELIRQADAETLEKMSPAIRIDGITAINLAHKGYRFACAAAAHTDDEEALARLARHSSLTVRRTVATNPALTDDTVDYLWQWALSRGDFDTLTPLAGRRPVESILSECVLTHMTGKNHRMVADLVRHLLDEKGAGFHAELLALADRLLGDDEVDMTTARLLTEVVVDHLLTYGGDIPDQLAQIRSGIARRPSVGRKLMSILARKAPITAPVEQLFADLRFAGYVSDRTEVDDDTVIRLLETAPERLADFSATTVSYASDGSHVRLAEYLLANAKKYPIRAYKVINGELEPLAFLDLSLVEQAIRDLPYEKAESESMNVSKLLRFPHRWPSDVVVKILQHRFEARYYTKDPLAVWINGEFEHQQPTREEVAAVFANPINALKLPNYYGRSRRETSDAQRFIEYLISQGSLGTKEFEAFGDVLFAAAEDWKRLLDHPPAAEYAAKQVAARVGLTSENVRTVLAMLASSQVGFETTLQSIALMYPPGDRQEPSKDEAAILGLQLSML